MRVKRTVELIHEGRFAAEVEIELHYTDESWSPTMSGADAFKLEAMRDALRRGDLSAASEYGRVFELTPLTAD
jgi:hypothetical protein